MASKYMDLIERFQKKYGDDFNMDDLISVDRTIIDMYETQQRCRIYHGDGYTTDGYIGVTTGWKPCFIHLYNARSLGSSVTIGPNDKVIKVFEARSRVRH